jgi:3-hydroxyisobutyrate dehydrogenase
MFSLILAINQIALAEGLALGKSLGIDAKLLHDVINTSSGKPCHQ